MDMPLRRYEEEAAACRLFDRGEPGTARAYDELEDTRVQRHPIGLHTVSGCSEHPQPAFDLHGDRVLGDDDAVTGAGRALASEDLPRAVGDVLASHLHEAER